MPVVSVASGFAVSSAVTLTRGDRPLAITVASHVAREWRVAFSPDGGTTWAAYRREDGSPFTVASGVGAMVGVIQYPPSRTLRVEAGSLTVATTSVWVTELNRG
jgi:hypothetical protein